MAEKEYIERKRYIRDLTIIKKWADSPSTMDYAGELVLTVFLTKEEAERALDSSEKSNS